MTSSILLALSATLLLASVALSADIPALDRKDEEAPKPQDKCGKLILGQQCAFSGKCVDGCKKPYNCVAGSKGEKCTVDDDFCMCAELGKCTADDDCGEDSRCFEVNEDKFCVPKAFVDGEETCIDADALAHLASHELAYETHRVARVLCDTSGSCATKGHVVSYKGTAMMMKSYCKLVGCEDRIIKVNSPSYRMGLRVASKTDGLEYTAFAARYETRAEEVSIAAAVHMGL